MPALSKSEAVGDAIEAGLAELGLAVGVVLVTISRRKTPSLPGGKEPPEIVISIGEEGQIEPMDCTRDFVRYPVAVTIVTGGGAKLGDDATVRAWREQIRKKLQSRSVYAGLAGWNGVSTVGKAPFEPSALPKDYNFSMQVFTVEILESRT